MDNLACDESRYSSRRRIIPYAWLTRYRSCLLYTSDAADERSSVDLGGRRIIKKKTQITYGGLRYVQSQKQHDGATSAMKQKTIKKKSR